MFDGFILGLSAGSTCLVSCWPVFLPYLGAENLESTKQNGRYLASALLGRFLAYLAMGAVLGLMRGEALPFMDPELQRRLTPVTNIVIGLFLIAAALIRNTKKNRFCGLQPAGRSQSRSLSTYDEAALRYARIDPVEVRKGAGLEVESFPHLLEKYRRLAAKERASMGKTNPDVLLQERLQSGEKGVLLAEAYVNAGRLEAAETILRGQCSPEEETLVLALLGAVTAMKAQKTTSLPEAMRLCAFPDLPAGRIVDLLERGHLPLKLRPEAAAVEKNPDH